MAQSVAWMARIIFLLGAGASKDAGAPLMDDFLDKARELWITNKVPADVGSFEKVFNGVALLQRATAKAQLGIHNVESVFSAFEMASVLESFGEYSIEQIRDLAPAMQVVIAKTIEQTFVVPAIERLHGSQLPGQYQRLADLIKKLHGLLGRRPDYRFGFITFNYDLALDLTFEYLQIEADYGLENHPTGGIPVLKLHGSLNWARCPNPSCGQIVRWPAKEYLKRPALRHACSFAVPTEPAVLVPPTWSKFQRYETLRNIWKRAAKELCEAENIIVIGYSLPPSDGFFQFLYGLGTEGKAVFQRFWVFNPDPDGSVAERFEKLVGTGAKQRYRFWKMDFYQAIDELNRTFN